jgi:chromosomal replication initiation ATPase DnaA
MTVLESLDLRDLVDLLDEVCRRRAVTRDEVCGRARTRAVAHARHELWWRLRHHPEISFSFEEIGRLFQRNHATVIHGVRAHQRRPARGGPAA